MKILTHQLANGIRIIHHPSSSPVAHCGIMVNVGSRDERTDEQGISHFIEHALFKGTKKRKPFHILSRLEDVGGELNAYTTKEETWYYASFMKQYYYRSIELLGDIIFQSTFPKKELKKEKDVIMDEINSYLDSPSDAIFDEYEELVFKGHSLGRNILGNKKTLSSFNRKSVDEFMTSLYLTDQMTLSSVGDIDFKKLISYAEKHLGKITRRNEHSIRLPFNSYETFNLLVKKDLLQTHCILGNRAYSVHDPKAQTLILLSNLLGGPGMNSRLNLGIREKYGFTYAIESNYTTYADTGVWGIYFATEPQSVKKTIKLIHKELKKLRDKPMGPLQLKKAKQQLIGQLAIAQENNCNLMQSIAKSYQAFGKVESIQESNERIMAITSHEIQEVAKEIFNESCLSTLIYEPK
ncbi:MAG: peptidase M16 [Flavobacteriales bacterium]|nr:peptidase M16 [Flavobacteriales bacterium]|tara:strand:+ start:6147 stop:7373 length:1227 start_codon:yes stop_codon:yes gene_type:complete